jgi:hypothetical protein
MRTLRRNQNRDMSTFGKTPTTAQIIKNVSQKLGIGGIANQQGSAVNIYDTVSIATSANAQTLTFFKNASSKTKVFTNWQQGELKAGETLAVKYISLHIVETNNVSLSDVTTTITNFFPVGKTIATSVIAYGNGQFKIANVVVFKDYQFLELIPAFNPATTGVAAYDAAAITAPVLLGRSMIELESVPVIPPNQAIEFSIEIPPITLPFGNFAVMATFGRMGSIFSAKTSL